MAIIDTYKGKDVPASIYFELKGGLCPFCGLERSEVRRVGHHGFYCSTCDNHFIYTGQQ